MIFTDVGLLLQFSNLEAHVLKLRVEAERLVGGSYFKTFLSKDELILRLSRTPFDGVLPMIAANQFTLILIILKNMLLVLSTERFENSKLVFLKQVLFTG